MTHRSAYCELLSVPVQLGTRLFPQNVNLFFLLRMETGYHYTSCWPQILHPPASASLCWAHRHAPPCPTPDSGSRSPESQVSYLFPQYEFSRPQTLSHFVLHWPLRVSTSKSLQNKQVHAGPELGRTPNNAQGNSAAHGQLTGAPTLGYTDALRSHQTHRIWISF